MVADLIAAVGCIIVRVLVALHPAAFRCRFGEAIIDETITDIRAAVRLGLLPAAAATAAAVSDTARGVLLERLSQLDSLRRTMLNALVSDMRQSARLLRRDWRFTGVALSTLSAGLAMCVVVAVLVNTYLWRGLPYPDKHRLFDVAYAAPGAPWPTGMEKLDWSSLDDVIELAISWDLTSFTLRGGAFPEVVRSTWVTPGYMDGFAVRPALGRSFERSDYESGQPMVAIISHRLWQTRFAGDPAILGRIFEAYVNRPNEVEAFRIVGVLPPGHWHMNTFTEILAPLREPSYPYIVRVREGAPASLVADRITALVRSGLGNMPSDWRPLVTSTQRTYVAQIRPLLLSVAIATALVLLIACTNVSVLLTVRATRRQHENAVRHALGASAGQMTRATMVEPLLLGGAAVVLGLAVAWLTLATIAPGVERYLGRSVPGGIAAVQLDAQIIGITLAVGVLVVLVCAVVPIWLSRRTPARLAVSGGQKGATDGPVPRRARAVLIAAEVAACMTLLAGAGLTIRSAVQMLRVDMGLDAAGVVVGGFNLRTRTFPDAPSLAEFHARALARASQLQNVERVAFTNAWPLQRSETRDVAGSATAAFQTRAGIVGVTPDYFDLLRIPLHAGRGFAAGDRIGSAPVALVSRTLAARLWTNTNPMGQTLRMAPAPGSPADTQPESFTIIGVVGDVRHAHTDDDLADVYVPLLQSPEAGAFAYLRVSGDASAAEREFQRMLASLDSETGFVGARPLIEILNLQRAGSRMLATILVVFALFAAGLALIGIYGVIAYTVKQREREIAVRIAVGADRHAITRLLVRQGATVLGAGILIGVGGAFALGRVLSAQLFNVAPFDSTVIAAATIGLAVCGIVAIIWPARGAASMDPARLLKD